MNIDDLPWGYDGWENPKKFLDDEAEVDLENSDHCSERSIDDEPKKFVSLMMELKNLFLPTKMILMMMFEAQ